MIEPTDYPGIDYASGLANINKETGIHYGVINLHSLNKWVIEYFEAEYGDPTCPKCGDEVKNSSNFEDADKDFLCENCKETFWSDECYPEQPNGYLLNDGVYFATMSGDDDDIFVIRSPYYTHAQYCSPCCPGAGHLEHPCTNGPKTYCFGREFFDDEKVSYPIYSVETGKLLYKTEED